MKILDDLLTTLDLKTNVRDIRQGLFHNAVLTRNCGLASTLSQDALWQHREGEPLVKEPGYLLNKQVEKWPGWLIRNLYWRQPLVWPLSIHCSGIGFTLCQPGSDLPVNQRNS